MKIKILIPVYNDFESVSKLLVDINSTVLNNDKEFSVIIINDSSTDKVEINHSNTENIKSIKLINMKENKGHARCNAAGLKYIFENEEFDYIIPMDGDGEDRPEEIKKFIEFLKYDNSNSRWAPATDNNPANTDALTEGSSNLYFTNARADARITTSSVNALSDVTITTPATNHVLKYNGTAWVNTTSIDLERFTANTGNQSNVSMFTRFEPSAPQTYRTLNLRAESSTDMTHNGYGPSLGFMVRDDAGVDNSIGSISCTRDGADNTGKFTMSLYNAGTFNEVMTIDKDGNTTRTGALGLKVLASDPSVTSDFAHVYAKDDTGSAEIFVKDEAGNVTKISPHNEQGEWEYFSRNVNTGKVMRVNMEELIKDIEKLTGKQYIREE